MHLKSMKKKLFELINKFKLCSKTVTIKVFEFTKIIVFDARIRQVTNMATRKPLVNELKAELAMTTKMILFFFQIIRAKYGFLSTTFSWLQRNPFTL